MAKAPVSAPDPHVESEEESGEKDSSSEEVHNDAGSDTESGSEPETESKQTSNAQKPADGENQEHQTSDSSSEDEGEGEAEADGDEEVDEEEDGEEEEEESQSESDSEGGRVTKSDPTVKPILSKPLDGAPASKRGVSKPKTASLSSTSKKGANPAAGDKRPATSETGGDGEVTETKRPYKRTKKGIQESAKKPPKTISKPRKYFKRLWSEEDELAILKGMADFYAARKIDPFINLDAFHEFIKKLIHVDVRKSQLQDKIRKMRMKFLNTSDNENKGLGKAFNSDHDRKAFELSKKVWGNEPISSGRSARGAPSPRINGDLVKRSSTKNAKTKKAAAVVTDVVVHNEEIANEGGHDLDGISNGLEERLKSVNWGAQNLGIEEWSMQNSIHLVDGEKRAEMDEKWRRFRAEEAELHCKRLEFSRQEAALHSKRLELVSEEAKLVADALKSSRG